MKNRLWRSAFRAIVSLALVSIVIPVFSRPVHQAKKSEAAILAFLRQTNQVSNVEFYYTNNGTLFNSENGNEEGLFWPRGSGISYIFGGGLWFATLKFLNGHAMELCELGYNPNSGAGWFTPGEYSQFGHSVGTDGANPASKYISYVSPRYDPRTGVLVPNSSDSLTPPFYNWPLWDTSTSKRFLHNYYFGDYISDVNTRRTDSLSHGNRTAVPAIVSQEDILNLYSDADTTADPEYVAGAGYPFGIDIQEEVYSWGFGAYQNMIVVRYKVKNSSNDTLIDSWLAPAFDPDVDAAVGGPLNDANSYVNDSIGLTMSDPGSILQLVEPYHSHPSQLNMGVQWRNPIRPPNGMQPGMVGISLIETPVTGARKVIIPNDDSAALGGYGPNSIFQTRQLGLVTLRDWTILNDPAPDLRYQFVSSGIKDLWDGTFTDRRMMLATGPFNLVPGATAEITVAITFAHVSDLDYKKNFGALLLQTELAHQVFALIDSTNGSYEVNHFQVGSPSSVRNNSTPFGLGIEGNYPNPFSSSCTVRYSNIFPGEARVRVLDLLGRAIESFPLGMAEPGMHSFTLNGSGLVEGDYRVSVTVGSETVSTVVVHIP